MNATEINQLLNAARQGDAASEARLFTYLTERFRALTALRIWDPEEVGEVVQGAMLIICQEYKTLEISSSFAAWAYKVLENRIRTHTRSGRNYRSRVVNNDIAVEGAATVAEDLELRKRLTDCLRLICQANRQFARVLNLHGQGYATEEVCQRMQLLKNSYYTLLRRGRAMLAKCLETGSVK
jgi:RNA polymerase sigma factor (sigma-70 family)